MTPRLIIALLLMLAQLPAVATAQPMLFSRENLTIVTVRAPVVKTPEKTTANKKQKKPKVTVLPRKPVVTRHIISTEIYPLSATQFDWFLSREQLSPGRGIMVVLENKDEMALSASNVITPYDILFIHGTGRIQAIVPEVALAELSEPLEITGRIRAVLYLKSGTTEEQGIKPGDQVEHAMFAPAPKILQ